MSTTFLGTPELTIQGEGDDLRRLLARLDEPLAAGWRRHTEAEARLREWGVSAEMSRCFDCEAHEQYPAAVLWLHPRGPSELRVTDVFARGRRQLSGGEYAVILVDFETQVLEPAGRGLGLQIRHTVRRVTPDLYLSREGVRRLDDFSSHSDRAAPRPADCERWRAFINRAHLEGAAFEASLLDQWLKERGWPEEQRVQLLREYEASRSLLWAYDEERAQTCPP